MGNREREIWIVKKGGMGKGKYCTAELSPGAFFSD